MSIKIRRDLNNVIAIHNRIITALKAQKVRQDQMIERYENDVNKELNLPSARFLLWSRIVQPYMDSVISAKLMDFELIKQYEKFIKDIIQYESDFLVSESDIQDLEYNFDRVVDISLKLEKKIMDIKSTFSEEITNLRVHTINMYQEISKEIKHEDDHCIYCGIKLNIKKGDTKEECYGCNNLQEEVKPFLSGRPESAEGTGINEENEEPETNQEKNETELINQEEETKVEEEQDKSKEEQKEEIQIEEEQDEPKEEQKEEIKKPKESKIKKEFGKLISGWDNKYKEQIKTNKKILEGNE